MLRDTARNEPYRAALERAMRRFPGATVMERTLSHEKVQVKITMFIHVFFRVSKVRTSHLLLGSDHSVKVAGHWDWLWLPRDVSCQVRCQEGGNLRNVTGMVRRHAC